MIQEDFDPLSTQAVLGTADPIQLLEYPGIGEILLVVIAVIFFLFLNAFFVASEFAIVKVRASQLHVDEDSSPSRRRKIETSKHVVKHLDAFLSANQLGITFASLALGFLGEPLVAKLLAPTLHSLGWFSDSIIRIISIVVAYSLFTFFHVVLGELIPKSIAIRHPLATTLATAPWLKAFYNSFYFVIHIFNATANFILKKCFNIDASQGHSVVHSADELVHLVEESERSQEVTETEAEISKNALELNDMCVLDILTPRSEIDELDINDPFEKNLELARNSRHTRFPLVEGHLDNAKGWLHVKDILKLVGQEKPDLMSLRRELKVVPDSMKLDTLLNFFLREQVHFAMVVDEFGSPQGLVFLDTVLEQIVGDDIQDEFDLDEARDFVNMGNNTYIANGAVTLYELEEYLPELDLDCPGISTLGGYITHELDHIPEEGEELHIGHYLATVTGSDGRRITQVRLTRDEALAQEA